MAWTAPRTWVTAEVVTAAQMNEQVRDNSTWLKANTAQLISETVLTGDAATITFASIPATYRHLLIKWYARGDEDATNVEMYLTFNNDTGNNYDYMYYYFTDAGSGDVEAIGGAYIVAGKCPTATAPADVFDGGEILIPGYASAVGEKSLCGHSTLKSADAGGNYYAFHWAGWWDATVAAITEIDIDAEAGNFIAGSVFSLYGLP